MNPPTSLLLTDLYQLTMLQSYHALGFSDVAVFEFFVRKLPEKRNFLVAAGLEQVLEFLEQMQFTAQELQWLANCGRFQRSFVDSLGALRFTGNIDAMPEGSIFFANEPILRVTAPLAQAQLVETRIINLLQYATLVASQAVRVRLAAPQSLLVDFGLRRTHGAEAGLLSARAGYIAGLDGSSNMLAGMQWGIPLYGTMAHSYVQVHDLEEDAFAHYAHAYPHTATLLVDTYNTEAAVRKLPALMKAWAADGIAIQAVRLDSGDLAAHAFNVRGILNDAGLSTIQIFASGNLDEYAVAKLLKQHAPINGFGVGTLIGTSADQPYLDCAYKLQEYAHRPKRKTSEGKTTWPGRKQVYRQFDADGMMVKDVLTTAEDPQLGQPLLVPVMGAGRRTCGVADLPTIRQRLRISLAQLPPSLQSLAPAISPYHVQISPALQHLAQQMDAERH